MPKIVNAFKLFVLTSLKRIDDAVAADAASVLTDLAAEFDAKVERINADNDLSGTGKINAVDRAQAELEESIGAWRGEVVAPIEKLISSQERKLAEAAEPPKVSELEALRVELRHQAVLRQLDSLGLDPLTIKGSVGSWPEEIQAAVASAAPRAVKSDAGEVVFVELSAAAPTPTSPELEGTRTLRSALDGLSTQLLALTAQPGDMRLAPKDRARGGRTS